MIRRPTGSKTWKATSRPPLEARWSETAAGSESTARPETEASRNLRDPAWSWSGAFSVEYVERMDHPEDGKRHAWKSDPLIVLGARESRVHGEAAGQTETGSGQHRLHTRRRGNGVHTTEPDSPEGPIGPEGAFYLAGPLAHAGVPQGDLGNDEPSRQRVGSTGRAPSSSRASWNNEFRTSVHGSKPAPTVHHRSGGSKYPKGRARPGRGRSGYRRSRIDWCNGRWRASSKRSSRRTSSTARMDLGHGVTLITLCDRYASRS